MHKIILSIGSNIGDKQAYLNFAIKELQKENKLLKTSSFYLTSPVDYKNQDDFLNACVSLETNKTPMEFLAFSKKIEKKSNRKKIIQKGPRTLDIDIIFYDKLILSNPSLKIPHPGFQNRLFVLKPLLDINKNLINPVTKEKISDILKNNSFEGQTIKKLF